MRPDSCFKTNHNVERAHELRVRSGEINDPFVLSAALLSALQCVVSAFFGSLSGMALATGEFLVEYCPTSSAASTVPLANRTVPLFLGGLRISQHRRVVERDLQNLVVVGVVWEDRGVAAAAGVFLVGFGFFFLGL